MGKLGNCCCNCTIHEDGFDRTDANVLGGSWCEEPGTYGIDSNRAICITAEAVAVLNVRHPVPDEPMVVQFTTKDEVDQSGDRYRVCLNMIRTLTGTPEYCESENYYFVEFERNGTNDSKLRLGVVSGGVESILKEDDVLGLTGFSRVVKGIISDKEFCGFATNSVLSFVAIESPGLFNQGYYSGMQLMETNLLVDDFIFSKHHFTDALCDLCLCACESNHIPPKMIATITVQPEDCVRLDLLPDCQVELEYDRITATWVGSSLCCDGGQQWDLAWTCPTYGDPTTAVLAILIGCLNSCGSCDVPLVEYDCDTNCYKYGPLLVSAFDLTCPCSSEPFDIMNPGGRGNCSYYIEVCEP